MVHPDHHALAVLVARLQQALDAWQRERERPLAQHVGPGRERRHGVDLVQVIGRADHHGVDRCVAQHVLDVVVAVPDLEVAGEAAGLGDVVVADRHHLDPGHPAQRRQVRDLRDGARADHADADRVVHPPFPFPPAPAQRYMTPARRLSVESPLATTPRPSRVRRQRFPPTSAPSVPFSPAVKPFNAS